MPHVRYRLYLLKSAHRVFLIFHVLEESIFTISNGSAARVNVGSPMSRVDRNLGEFSVLVLGEHVTMEAHGVEMAHRRQKVLGRCAVSLQGVKPEGSGIFAGTREMLLGFETRVGLVQDMGRV